MSYNYFIKMPSSIFTNPEHRTASICLTNKKILCKLKASIDIFILLNTHGCLGFGDKTIKG